MDERYKVAISRLGNRVRVAGSAEIGGSPTRQSERAQATLDKVLDDWFPGVTRRSAGAALERRAADAARRPAGARRERLPRRLAQPRPRRQRLGARPAARRALLADAIAGRDADRHRRPRHRAAARHDDDSTLARSVASFMSDIERIDSQVGREPLFGVAATRARSKPPRCAGAAAIHADGARRRSGRAACAGDRAACAHGARPGRPGQQRRRRLRGGDPPARRSARTPSCAARRRPRPLAGRRRPGARPRRRCRRRARSVFGRGRCRGRDAGPRHRRPARHRRSAAGAGRRSRRRSRTSPPSPRAARTSSRSTCLRASTASAASRSAPSCVVADDTLALLALEARPLHGRRARSRRPDLARFARRRRRRRRGDAWLVGGADPSCRRVARRHADHKGSFGDVAVVGGAPGMAGAAWLAARAAHAAGAGRVFVDLLDAEATSPAFALDPLRPELMFRADWWRGATSALAEATVVCGCGGGDAVRAALPRLLSVASRLVARRRRAQRDRRRRVAAEPARRPGAHAGWRRS